MTTESIIEQIRETLGVSPKKTEQKNQKVVDLINSDEYKVKAEYSLKTESYRVKINKSNDLKEIAKLALECITELTGDEVFYKTNIKKIV